MGLVKNEKSRGSGLALPSLVGDTKRSQRKSYKKVLEDWGNVDNLVLTEPVTLLLGTPIANVVGYGKGRNVM